MSLFQIRTDNPSRIKMEQLVLLIDELVKRQYELPSNSRDAENFQDRLLSACHGISECECSLQIQNASNDGLVAALRESITTVEANEPTNMSQRLNYNNTSAVNTCEKDRQHQKHNKNAHFIQDHVYENSSCNENVA